MNEIAATLPLSDLGDLDKSPHVLPQLIDMITGKCELMSAQQEQRWEHLAKCIQCQAFLGTYLAEMIEYDKVHGNPVSPAQKLLDQMTQIMHKTLEEDIPAYVETIEEQGGEEAKSRFPQFTDHMQVCLECKRAVQDLQSWLRQSGEAGSL